MPNLRSSKKRMRQTITRTKRNRLQRGALRSAMKKVRVAQTAVEASAAFALAERLLDRAARKHLIHRNNAAHHKSHLLEVVQSKSS